MPTCRHILVSSGLVREPGGLPPMRTECSAGPSRQLSNDSADRPWLQPPAIEALEKSRKVIPRRLESSFFKALGTPAYAEATEMLSFIRASTASEKMVRSMAIHYIRKCVLEEICCCYPSGTLNHLQKSIQLSYERQFSFHRSATSKRLRQAPKRTCQRNKAGKFLPGKPGRGRKMRITSGRQRAAQSSGRSPGWRP